MGSSTPKEVVRGVCVGETRPKTEGTEDKGGDGGDVGSPESKSQGRTGKVDLLSERSRRRTRVKEEGVEGIKLKVDNRDMCVEGSVCSCPPRK